MLPLPLLYRNPLAAVPQGVAASSRQACRSSPRAGLCCTVLSAVPPSMASTKTGAPLDVQVARGGGSPRQALDDRRDQHPCTLLQRASV